MNARLCAFSGPLSRRFNNVILPSCTLLTSVRFCDGDEAEGLSLDGQLPEKQLKQWMKRRIEEDIRNNRSHEVRERKRKRKRRDEGWRQGGARRKETTAEMRTNSFRPVNNRPITITRPDSQVRMHENTRFKRTLHKKKATSWKCPFSVETRGFWKRIF